MRRSILALILILAIPAVPTTAFASTDRSYPVQCLWKFGRGLYKPATGEAVVFSCSLLHEAMPVTEGTRYVLLSFLYGPEDEKMRLAGKQQRQTRVVGS